jgi:uncharacterized protein (DUF2344 family)
MLQMKNKNVWHIEPKGSITQKAIINALNFLIDIVYETIVKPNGERLDQNINDTEALKQENEQLKKQTSEDNDSILDLDYRVTMLEE